MIVLLLTLAQTAPVSLATPDPVAVPAQLLSGGPNSRDYPHAALAAGAQGVTHARILVGQDGRAQSCDIVGSAGHPALDQQTCRLALYRMKFRPAADKDGLPRPQSVILPIRWALGE